MSVSTVRIALLAITLSTCLVAQQGIVEMEQTMESGLHRNQQSIGVLAWSQLVQLPGVSSMQLKFAEAVLGPDDRIVVTSQLDGHRMEMSTATLKNWERHSAWFNGDAVEVALYVQPGSEASVSLASVFADTGTVLPETICGPTDDRTVTFDDRTCRVVPSTTSSCSYPGPCAASAWRVANSNAIATARHVAVLTFFSVAEFNSPASNATTGAIVHPAPADQWPILRGTIQQSSASALGDDWAVATVGPNSAGQSLFERYGRGFLTASTLPAINDTIRITGNGIDNTPDPSRHHRTQTDTGPLTGVSGTRLLYQADTTNGNSGSAVQNAATGEVIGIHTNGGCGASSGSNSGTSILNPALQTAIANLGACQTLNLSSGASQDISTCASAQFSFTPGASRWNVVGVSGAGDWDIILDGVTSARGGSLCDFLLSNGNDGSTPANFPGWMYRFSGTATARGGFDSASTISLNRASSVFFSSTDIIETVQFEVTAAGSYDTTVDGTQANGVRWHVYRPTGNASWFRRDTNRVASGSVGGSPQTASLNPGWHCMVIYRDGGSSGTSESLWVNVCDAVAPLTLAAGSPQTVNEDCRRIDFTPTAGRWNVVGVSGPTDWDVIVGPAEARSGGSACDFVIADGHNGTISPTYGTVNRFGSVAGAATVKHEVATTTFLNNDIVGSLSTADIMQAYEFDVSTTGNHILTAVGDSSLDWRLFRPASDATWAIDSSDVIGGNVGGNNVTVNLNVTGRWCLVVYSNGGPPANTAPFLLHICTSTSSVALSSSVVATAVSGACAPFSMTPVSGRWNAVGVSSTSDWDIALGPLYSRFGGSSCDYMIADGRQGTVSPTEGALMRFSGSADSHAGVATIVTVNPGATYNAGWSSSQIIRVFEFTIPTADDYDISVNGLTGLRWSLHLADTDAAWQPASSSSDSRNAVPSSVSSLALPAGTHCLVVTKDGGPGISGSFTIDVGLTPNPVPILTSVSPTSRVAGSGAFTLTATGSAFVDGASVLWDGAALATTFVSSTQLTATVPSSQLVGAGNVTVRVQNPTPGGGLSGAQTFVVRNPIPVATSLSPSIRTAGSTGFTLVVNGSNFNGSTRVRFGGVTLTSALLNPTTLRASVPSSLITTPGTVSVTVENPGPGGGTDVLPFTVGFPVPAISSLSPSGTIAGSAGLNLIVTGSRFHASSVVLLDGAPLSTVFISPTNLRASIPASLVEDIGVLPVTVRNPSPGGGTSPALGFNVAGPRVVSLSPPVVPVQPAGSVVNVIVNGSSFLPSSVVYANSDPLPTTFISTTQLLATIDATQQPMLQVNGNLALTVRNSSTAFSNVEVFQSGGSSNRGLLVRDPIAPAPGGGYALQATDGTPGSVYTLILDLAPVTTTSLYPFLDPIANYSLNVRPAGPPTSWFPLFDGFGLYGPPQPFAVYGPGGSFTVPGFAAPNPPLGIDLTAQALYLDPTVPVGYRMTWARHADRL